MNLAEKNEILNKSAEQILTDMINKTNGTNSKFVPYEYGQLRFYDVRQEYEIDDSRWSVAVSDKDAESAADCVRIYYRKISITEFIPTGYELKYSELYEDFNELIEALNTALGRQINPQDLLPIKVDSANAVAGKLTVPIVARDNALLLRGGTFVVLTQVPEKTAALTEE